MQKCGFSDRSGQSWNGRGGHLEQGQASRQGTSPSAETPIVQLGNQYVAPRFEPDSSIVPREPILCPGRLWDDRRVGKKTGYKVSRAGALRELWTPCWSQSIARKTEYWVSVWQSKKLAACKRILWKQIATLIDWGSKRRCKRREWQKCKSRFVWSWKAALERLWRKKPTVW